MSEPVGEGNTPPFSVDPFHQSPSSINVDISEEGQKAIVKLANQFKQAVMSHDKEKKEKMRQCYAYTKGKFSGNDLLPRPVSIEGDPLNNERDEKRPKVFIPVVRQQLKELFSNISLSIFPNEDNYIRIRAKTPQGVEMEDELTEAFIFKLKEANIPYKIKRFLYNLCWAGNGVAYPCVREETRWEWNQNPYTGQYESEEVKLPVMPDLEIFNPLHFHIDPIETDPEKARWMMSTIKKVQELKDSAHYFNTADLEKIGKSPQSIPQELAQLNNLSPTNQDSEKHIAYDLYYFPVLSIPGLSKPYRNMIVGVAGEQTLIRFHPNLFPKGMNPCVFTAWTQDVDTLNGTGPIEDILELQRLINMLYNYMLESMARNGNRWIVGPDVDISNAHGVAGGVIYASDVSQVIPVMGDMREFQVLQNTIGVVKAEAQVTTASQNPFQGSSSIDFKKTATEMQLLHEKSMSVMREAIEHIATMGVRKILERIMYLCADIYSEPIEIRIDNSITGRTFSLIDFSVVKSGDFTVELIGINPSQSKQAQLESLSQLAQMVINNGPALSALEPIIKRMGELQGLRDIDNLLEKIKEGIAFAQQGVTGIPIQKTGMGSMPVPAMDPGA